MANVRRAWLLTVLLALRVVNVAPERLAVRSEPSRKADLRQQIPEGTIVSALGTATDDGAYVWLAVRTAGGTEGWAAGRTSDHVSPAAEYLIVVANTAPPIPPPPVPPDPLPAVRAQLRALADDATLTAAALRDRLTAILAALPGEPALAPPSRDRG